MKKYIDFETCNSDGYPFQIGVAHEDGDYYDIYINPQVKWFGFHFAFHQADEVRTFVDPHTGESIECSLLDYLEDCPTFEEVIAELPDLFDGELYAWNAGTERKALRLGGLERTVIDLLPLTKRLYPDFDKYGLERVIQHLGIEFDGEYHDAAQDAIATALIHQKLMEHPDYDTQFEEYLHKADIKRKPRKEYNPENRPDDAARVASAKASGERNGFISHVDGDQVESLDLNGKAVVISGTHPTLTRRELTEKLESYGAKVRGSISNSTDYLIVGSDTIGPKKMQKAIECNVSVINAERALELLDGE